MLECWASSFFDSAGCINRLTLATSATVVAVKRFMVMQQLTMPMQTNYMDDHFIMMQ